MKIATWNVAKPVVSMRSKRLDRIIEAIKAEQADIWVLTETHPEVVPGAGYCSVPTADLFSGEKWVMIWSQYPIENIPIQSCDSLSVAALVKPPNRTAMIVCGVVLPWVGSK